MACEFIVGVRDERRSLLDNARLLGAPILISANAFNRRWTSAMRAADRPFPGFKPAARDGRWSGLRVCLDSGGYVAARRFGDFHFMTHRNPATYLALARSLIEGGATLEWWASADLCCEPEIAADQEEILLRLARNAHAYDLLCDLADDAGFPRPMPVLQGRTPTDYLRSYNLMFDYAGAPEVPSLVGLGSMCRRPASAIVATLDVLDSLLPQGVRVHLFGVISTALRRVAAFDRVSSTDSCAYDLSDRIASWDGVSARSNASLSGAMTAFVGRQRALVANPDRTPCPRALPIAEPLRLRHRDLPYRQELVDLLLAARNGEVDPIGWHHARTMADRRRDVRTFD